MLPYQLPENASICIERALFTLSGPDSARYLNGQCTQDVHLASKTEAVYALITNFKGKIDGDCYVRQHEGSLMIDAPIELQQELFERLDRYIIADDVELNDITASYRMRHTIEPTTTLEGWRCMRFGQSGVDELISSNQPSTSTLSETEIEKSRISHGIPKWGTELNHNTLPPEANLEQRAISYTKGCYTGQEVISRIRSAGKVNKSLIALQSSEPLHSGDLLICNGATKEKPAGKITSACTIEDTHIALAYLKRKYQDSQTFQINDHTAQRVIL